MVTERGSPMVGSGHTAVKTVLIPNGALTDCTSERGLERTYGIVTLEVAPA